jgi:hypothetical protein
MPDLTKLANAHFRPRTAEVDVPELAFMFGEDEKQVFKVRGLDSEELAQADDAKNKQERMAKAFAAVTAGDASVQELQEVMGLDDSSPAAYVRELAVLRLGCVDPQLQHSHCLKIARHPMVFKRLVNRILSLSGEGPSMGKPGRSGGGPTSETA